MSEFKLLPFQDDIVERDTQKHTCQLQRKFRQADADESYFDSDEDDDPIGASLPTICSSIDDVVDSERTESALPLTNLTPLRNAEQA